MRGVVIYLFIFFCKMTIRLSVEFGNRISYSSKQLLVSEVAIQLPINRKKTQHAINYNCFIERTLLWVYKMQCKTSNLVVKYNNNIFYKVASSNRLFNRYLCVNVVLSYRTIQRPGKQKNRKSSLS